MQVLCKKNFDGGVINDLQIGILWFTTPVFTYTKSVYSQEYWICVTKFKLVSSAETGHFYTTTTNKKTLELKNIPYGIAKNSVF
jgi:hypothetical protein